MSAHGRACRLSLAASDGEFVRYQPAGRAATSKKVPPLERVVGDPTGSFAPYRLAVLSLGCPGGGDRFESGMDAESPKETADVVPDGLDAQMKLCCDLLGRAPLFQQAKHLDLTRSEVGWRHRCAVRARLDQPEDADNPITAHQGHGTDFHGHPCAAGRYEDGVRIRSRGSAEHLASEQLAVRDGCPPAQRRT